MNKNEILKYIKKEVNYAELPSKMDVRICDDTLYITMDAEGVLQNMQNDESSFEGWIFCIKAIFSNIKNAVIDWEKPTFSLDKIEREKQEKHYQRFLIRVIWFVENYSWARVVEPKSAEMKYFRNSFSHLILNYPHQNSKNKSEKDENDQKVKYEAMLETAIYQHLSKTCVANHQLPMGLFNGLVSTDTAITPRGASQADLWKIEEDEFCVYELKDSLNTNNTRVGIISELMFYANVLHRLLITQEIKYPCKADNYRTNKRSDAFRGFEHILDAIHEHSITHIKAVLLTDRLHPLIEYNRNQLLYDMSKCKANIKFEHSTVWQILPLELIPTPTYKEVQRAHQIGFLQKSSFFSGVNGWGNWDTGSQKIALPYIIEDGKEAMNLYPAIRKQALNYFLKNRIAWWKNKEKPSGHLLSSQISCVNHLFPFMKKEGSATLVSMLNSIQDKFCFDRILTNPLDFDKCNGNICFEFIWKNRTLLGESYEIRGRKCTSVDAVIYAETSDLRRILIPIEWKYTETYAHKRAEQTSIDRYKPLLDNRSNIKEWKTEYEYNPQYELVRQTLLIEQIIIKRQDNKLPVDDYLHIMVVPEGNAELRSMISLYPKGLKDKGKFIIVDPKKLMEPIKDTHKELYNYLETRYWQ